MKLNLDLFFKAFQSKEESTLDNDTVITSFIKDIYRQPLPGKGHSSPNSEKAITPNNGDNPTIFRAQIDRMCQLMKNHGMDNFASLKTHFVQGKTITPLMQSIKKTMEYIVYAMHNHPTRSVKELAIEYRDRVFICDEGTLTNLQEILSELTLPQASIETYVAQAKKDVIEQLGRDMRLKGKFKEFNQKDTKYERHDISSLLNSVANECGLPIKTKEEDEKIKTLSRDSHTIFLEAIHNHLSQPDVIEGIIHRTVDNLMLSLPIFDPKKYPTHNKDGRINNAFYNDLMQHANQLGMVIDPSELIDREEMVSKGYKTNYREIIQHALISYLGKTGIITTNVAFSNLITRLENESLSDEYSSRVLTAELFEDCITSKLWPEISQYLLENQFTLDSTLYKTLKNEPRTKATGFILRYAIEKDDADLFESTLKSKAILPEQRDRILSHAEQRNAKNIIHKLNPPKEESLQPVKTMRLMGEKPPIRNNLKGNIEKRDQTVIKEVSNNKKKAPVTTPKNVTSRLKEALLKNQPKTVQEILLSKDANNLPSNGEFSLANLLEWSVSHNHMAVCLSVLQLDHASQISEDTFFDATQKLYSGNTQEKMNHTTKGHIKMHVSHYLQQHSQLLTHSWKDYLGLEKDRNGLYYDSAKETFYLFKDGDIQKTLELDSILTKAGERKAFTGLFIERTKKLRTKIDSPEIDKVQKENPKIER